MKRKQMIGLGVVAGFGMLTGLASGQDEGATILFEPGVIVDQFPNAVGSRLAVDGQGNVYVATVDGTGGDRDIYFNRSTDYGDSFEQPYQTVGGVGNPGWAVYHQIAANSIGDVYVMWEDLRAGQHAYINVSNDGGVTFNGETRVDDVGSAWQPRVAADDMGGVFVSYGTSGAQIRVAVSSDHGQTFETQSTISGGYPGALSNIATDGQGGVYVVFSDSPLLDFYFTRSLDAGVTWSVPIQLGNFGRYYNWAQNAPVAAEGDSVYVTWTADYGAGWDVYLMKSEDAGATFGAPTLVSVDSRPYGPSGSSPPIAVSGETVTINWHRTGESWFAVSTDGGATFAPAQNATDGYVGGFAASDGLIYTSYQPFDDNTVVGFALGVIHFGPRTIEVPGDFGSIQEAIDFAESGDEIVVAPGNYAGSVDFLGKAVRLYSSNGPQVTVIDGNGVDHVVQCVSGETADTVLDGFTVTGGDASGADDAAYGGGMYLDGSSPTIADCHFVGNQCELDGAGVYMRSGSAPHFTDCVFSDNSADGRGGGLGADASTPVLDRCILLSNVAEDGGAMALLNGSDAAVTYTEYSMNLSTRFGGALLSENSTPSISQCSFSGNSATDRGGAYYFGTGQPTLTDCVFSENTTTGWGGAVCNGIETETTLARCTFTANQATHGGGVFCQQNSSTALTACTFATNVSTAWGGGVFANQGATVTATDCTFESNHADDRGGGLAGAYSSILTLIECTFARNESQSYGGATYTHDDSTATATDCTFESNQSQYGGAMFCAAYGEASLYGCMFVGNTATNGGGGLYGGVYTGLALAECTLAENTAGGTGGGMNIADGSQLTLTSCILTQNEAGAGGGGLGSGAAIVTIAYCRFEANATTGAYGGGGIYAGEGSRYSISGTEIVGNSTTRHGGGMRALPGSAVDLANCSFVDNDAAQAAGAIFTHENSCDVVNCYFSRNRAMTYGGAVYSNLATLSMANCSFGGNAAGISGGAVLSYRGGITVANCILWSDSPHEIDNYNNESSLSVTHSNVQGGYPGTGNIDAEPRFVDLYGGDLHLRPDSPCIDAGSNQAIPYGIDTDYDGNSRIIDGDFDENAVVDMGVYECEPMDAGAVVNLTRGLVYTSIRNAIEEATDGDFILASSSVFEDEPLIDFSNLAMTLQSHETLVQPPGGLYVLADNSNLRSAGGEDITLHGDLRVNGGDTADVRAERLGTTSSSNLELRLTASLFVSAPGGTTLDGDTTLLGENTLGVDGALANTGSLAGFDARLFLDGMSNAGNMTLANLWMSADHLHNDAAGAFVGDGTMFTSITNDGAMTYLADTLAVGDYTNNGTTKVALGTLTIIGTLTNNGVLIGDIMNPRPIGGATDSGDGMSIEGDFIAGPDAAFLWPDPIWRLTLTGSYDVAIDDNSRYDMIDAELTLAGGGTASTLEVMSTDVGAARIGLDPAQPGHFPIGVLRIGPADRSVALVDAHDNDALGQQTDEAVYVRELVVERGGELRTNGLLVYYETLVLEGEVDDARNLIPIPTPTCRADLNGDGLVDRADLIVVLTAWGECAACPADLDGSGAVDFADLIVVLTAWGVCE